MSLIEPAILVAVYAGKVVKVKHEPPRKTLQFQKSLHRPSCE